MAPPPGRLWPGTAAPGLLPPEGGVTGRLATPGFTGRLPLIPVLGREPPLEGGATAGRLGVGWLSPGRRALPPPWEPLGREAPPLLLFGRFPPLEGNVPEGRVLPVGRVIAPLLGRELPPPAGRVTVPCVGREPPPLGRDT